MLPFSWAAIQLPPASPSSGNIILPDSKLYTDGASASVRQFFSSRLEVRKIFSLLGMYVTVHMIAVLNCRRRHAEPVGQCDVGHFFYSHANERHVMYGMLEVIG